MTSIETGNHAGLPRFLGSSVPNRTTGSFSENIGNFLSITNTVEHDLRSLKLK